MQTGPRILALSKCIMRLGTESKARSYLKFHERSNQQDSMYSFILSLTQIDFKPFRLKYLQIHRIVCSPPATPGIRKNVALGC